MELGVVYLAMAVAILQPSLERCAALSPFASPTRLDIPQWS